MASLARLPELVGFFSYSREDDEAFRGSLSVLRDAIQRELGAQLGRTKRNFRLWQDQEAIAPGKDWEAEITRAVEQSVFFIPIVTPRAVSSDYCQFEFSSFVARERALGRSDLVFPILYISVSALMNEAEWRNDPVLSIVAKRQYVDWRPFRHDPVNSPALGQAIERLCAKIVESLHEPWVSPEERGQLDADAKRRADEEERVRQEAEAKKRAEREALEREKAERLSQATEAKKRADRERRAGVATEAERTAKISTHVGVAASVGAVPSGVTAPGQPTREMAGTSSGKYWRVFAAVAGVALVGAAMALLVERSTRQFYPSIVESSSPTPPPNSAVAPAPVVPPPPPTAPDLKPVQVFPEPAPAKDESHALPNVTALTAAQERALKAGDPFRECSDCPEMIVVPAGRFAMGSPWGQGNWWERPQHDVTIAKPFAIAKFELTFDEWDACSAHGDCPAIDFDGGWGRGRRPAINVSWDQAQTYVKWLSRITGKPYRLLSEAEYEYAARAGSQTNFPWGDNIKLNGQPMANCKGCGSQWDNKQTAPVGSFSANAFGLYDMVGNVYEWTEDCVRPNLSPEGAPADGSPWTSGDCSSRIVHGGSWDSTPGSLRSAFSGWDVTVYRSNNHGFRVARTLSP